LPVKIKIYGAGSIGNHCAYSYSKAGCEVTIFDIDKNILGSNARALIMKKEVINVDTHKDLRVLRKLI
jgi:pyruvate/2-oxoglutarate dehydrogenase complex dihydrolipoamide dehydrogenase (E3) component